MDPVGAIRLGFRTSDEKNKAVNVDTFLSLLPKLLRYTRAIKIISDYGATKDGERYDSMLPGALIISELFYPPGNSADLEENVEKGIRHLFEASKSELLAATCDLSNEFRYEENEEKKVFRAIDIIKAFNSAIVNSSGEASYNESPRTGQQQQRVHLVDEALLSRKVYQRAIPITKAIIFCEVVHRLGLRAEGVPFPRTFMARAVTKEVDEKGDAISAAIKDGVGSFVPADALSGDWLAAYIDGMEEVALSIRPGFVEDDEHTLDGLNKALTAATASGAKTLALGSVLEAVKMDGDTFVPAGEVTWKVQIPSDDLHDASSKRSGFVVGKIYGAMCKIAKPGFESAMFVPCTMTLIAVTPSVDADGSASTRSCLEIVIELSADALGISDDDQEDRTKSSAESPKSIRLNFIRVSDLNSCLLDVSGNKCILLTPSVYHNLLQRYVLTSYVFHFLPP
jgi:hypothetical protein